MSFPTPVWNDNPHESLQTVESGIPLVLNDFITKNTNSENTRYFWKTINKWIFKREPTPHRNSGNLQNADMNSLSNYAKHSHLIRYKLDQSHSPQLAAISCVLDAPPTLRWPRQIPWNSIAYLQSPVQSALYRHTFTRVRSASRYCRYQRIQFISFFLQFLDQRFNGTFCEAFAFAALPVTHKRVDNAQTRVRRRWRRCRRRWWGPRGR